MTDDPMVLAERDLARALANTCAKVAQVEEAKLKQEVARLTAVLERIARPVSGTVAYRPARWAAEALAAAPETLHPLDERRCATEGHDYARGYGVTPYCKRCGAAEPQERPKRCPRCDSPDPKLHPAMQFEGEVQPCEHPWHGEHAGMPKAWGPHGEPQEDEHG